MDNIIKDIYEKIDNADAIVIGAGSGLSTAAGLTYSGERFERTFGAFIEKYDLTDMYSSGFYPFKTEEERWAYWSKHVFHNRYDVTAGEVYLNLLERIKDKEYFVLTTNVDHQFWLAGFDDERVFATQGDYGKIQCAKPCHQKIYDNEEMIRKMVQVEKECKVPSDLIPKCPVCGGPMDMHLRKDDTFVEDEAWHEAHKRYQTFIKTHHQKEIVFLELGVGMNTPVIIKYPFWRLTDQLEHGSYICINQGAARGPEQIADKAIYYNGDIGDVF